MWPSLEAKEKTISRIRFPRHQQEWIARVFTHLPLLSVLINMCSVNSLIKNTFNVFVSFQDYIRLYCPSTGCNVAACGTVWDARSGFSRRRGFVILELVSCWSRSIRPNTTLSWSTRIMYWSYRTVTYDIPCDIIISCYHYIIY